MTETLNKIQKLSKAGLIISKIVLWCGIMSVVCCSILLITQLIIGNNHIVINGTNINSILDSYGKLNYGTVLAGTTVGIIVGISDIIKSKLSIKYFDKELELGTPFDLELSKQLKQLGIRIIVISLVAVIIASITYEIYGRYYTNLNDFDVDNLSSITTGIVFIIISLICKYGAQMKEGK